MPRGVAASCAFSASIARPWPSSRWCIACVAQRTHYVDITGETPWVRSLIESHHERAARDGTRIIPCCGFDSVPSDLGAWLVAQALWHRLGAQIEDGQRNVYYELAFEQMIAAGWQFSVADVTGLHCMEIDTPEDLAAAHRLAERMAQRNTDAGTQPSP